MCDKTDLSQQLPLFITTLFEMSPHEGGLSGIEDFPAGEAVADEVKFIEGPNDLAIFIKLDDLRVFVSGVAVADDDIAIGKFLKVCGPGQFDFRAGDFLFYFPDDLFVGRDFENGITAARGDEGVSVCEPNGSEDAGLGGVFPDDFSRGIVFGDNTRILGTGKVVAVGKDFEHAGLVATVFGKGDLLDYFMVLTKVDDPADSALGDHCITIFQALESVNVGPFGVVLPGDFFIKCNL